MLSCMQWLENIAKIFQGKIEFFPFLFFFYWGTFRSQTFYDLRLKFIDSHLCPVFNLLVSFPSKKDENLS